MKNTYPLEFFLFYIVRWIALGPQMSVAGKFAVSSVGGRWAGWRRSVTKAQFFQLEATGQQIPGLDQEEHNGKVADVRCGGRRSSTNRATCQSRGSCRMFARSSLGHRLVIPSREELYPQLPALAE